MTMKRRLAVATAALVLAAGCSNTGGSSSSGDRDESGPLKIGVIVPLSGAAGPNGKHVLAAIQTQAELINKQGGVDGRKIQIVSKDDQSTPATGVSAATEMVSKKVDVVMGGWNSPVTLAIQPILVRGKTLNITTIPQNSAILGGADDAAIRMNAGNAVGGYVAAKYLSGTLKAKRIGLLLQNDAYGKDAGDFLRKNLPSGVKIATEQKFAYTDTDFRVALSSLKAAKPDAVFSANAAESSGQPALMKQLSQAGLHVPYFAGTGTVSQTVIDVAGAGANETYSADLYFPEAEPWASSEKNKAFIASFQKKTGDKPDKFAALGAQSVDVWAKAVEKAGSTDRTKVADAIKGATFKDTLLGDVSFTAVGQMISPMYAFQVKNQKVKVLDEIPVPDKIWEQ
jgi:branched-chain amino acid transport system substrate-binding protein